MRTDCFLVIQAAGISLALGSRLINKETLEDPAKQSALVSALLDASKVTPRLIMHSSAPFSCPGDGATSVNEAWRSSVYHITVISSWNWNATTEDKRKAYSAVTRSMDYLRDLTPDAAYLVSYFPCFREAGFIRDAHLPLSSTERS